MTAAAIAGGVHLADACVVFARWGVDVAARVFLEIELLDQLLLGSHEAHGEQDQVALVLLLAARYLDDLPSALFVLFPLDLHGLDGLDVAVRVADELLGGDLKDARILVVGEHGLLVAVVELEDLGPRGPRIVGGARLRRLGQNLEGDDVASALAQRRADAVVARVAAAHHEHALVLGQLLQLFDVLALGLLRLLLLLLPALQEAHGEVDAVELSAGYVEVARPRGARRDQYGVVLDEQALRVDVLADLDVGAELDALLGHEVDASLHDVLGQLHGRYAVAEEAADGVVPLEHGDQVADTVELMSGRQTGRARADDGHATTCALLGYLGLHPALLERVVDNGALDVLDRYRALVDAQHTAALARRRTHSTF